MSERATDHPPHPDGRRPWHRPHLRTLTMDVGGGPWGKPFEDEKFSPSGDV